MAQYIKSPQIIVTKEIVEVKDGKCEVTIKLDLNINLGGVPIVTEEKNKEMEVEKDILCYTIPDFQLQKIKFGEKVK